MFGFVTQWSSWDPLLLVGNRTVVSFHFWTFCLQQKLPWQHKELNNILFENSVVVPVATSKVMLIELSLLLINLLVKRVQHTTITIQEGPKKGRLLKITTPHFWTWYSMNLPLNDLRSNEKKCVHSLYDIIFVKWDNASLHTWQAIEQEITRMIQIHHACGYGMCYRRQSREAWKKRNQNVSVDGITRNFMDNKRTSECAKSWSFFLIALTPDHRCTLLLLSERCTF